MPPRPTIRLITPPSQLIPPVDEERSDFLVPHRPAPHPPIPLRPPPPIPLRPPPPPPELIGLAAMGIETPRGSSSESDKQSGDGSDSSHQEEKKRGFRATLKRMLSREKLSSTKEGASASSTDPDAEPRPPPSFAGWVNPHPTVPLSSGMGGITVTSEYSVTFEQTLTRTPTSASLSTINIEGPMTAARRAAAAVKEAKEAKKAAKQKAKEKDSSKDADASTSTATTGNKAIDPNFPFPDPTEADLERMERAETGEEEKDKGKGIARSATMAVSRAWNKVFE
ncbi:uncharacterized protein F4822DRAFT_431045 [Hypoxylon trugodes]|uniref:uncharacterized protein n=1 Tax=Hypoxylon trugodes TaxID=326681 RepID=UPI002196DB13|nr:uncharacterized protein F4822DRAFT_431045 [Hypoxylon trugodes]KAI1386171.1 hypothetical protein F4822DRAFT_431045 [Hypoxylon trugodes]